MVILKARFRSKQQFLEAYNGDLPHGGVFCATTRSLGENDPVIVEVRFPGLPNKMLLRGRVIWWRSAVPRLRVRAGALVAFGEDEQEKRDFILDVAEGQRPDAIKRRYPRIPIEAIVRWRANDSTTFHEGLMRDISIGGAQLETDQLLTVDQEIILELTTPGGARPIAISGKVTHRTPTSAGIKFIYRDGGGSQRLREVVRRMLDT